MRIESPHLIPTSAIGKQSRGQFVGQGRADSVVARGDRAIDSVELRQIAIALRAKLAIELPDQPGSAGSESTASAPSAGAAPAQQAPEYAAANASGEAELTPEEAREVEKLKARDREVRAHEQAHLAAAGSYAIGGPTYEYERGPDNRPYAVGGEVEIDTSPERNPEATLRKAQTVRRAALAPAQPSPQDRRVAAQAARMEAEARRELARERIEDRSADDGAESDKVGSVGTPDTKAKAGSETASIGHFVDAIA